jgi:hypothetical protein
VKRGLLLILVFLSSGCGLHVGVGPAGVVFDLGQPGKVVGVVPDPPFVVPVAPVGSGLPAASPAPVTINVGR